MAAILLSSMFALLGLFTLWPGAIVEVLRDHAVLLLVALALVGAGAQAMLTVIKAAEDSRLREASAAGRPS